MTDIERYDRSLYSYLSGISDKVVYSVTDKAFQNMTKDQKYKDFIPYSMISYYRSPEIEIDQERMQFSSQTFGDYVRLTERQDKRREARYVQSIPINLNYQIDVWAAKETSVQETAVKLISKLHMQNQVLVAPMNPDEEPARFHMTNISWTDNSDLEAENEKGKLYRHTISLTLECVLKLFNDVETTQFLCNDIDIYN